MKKIISLLLALMLVLSFAACSKKTENKEETKENTTNVTTAPTEVDPEQHVIEWKTIPDMDIVGTYKLADGDDDGYYIFTAEKTLRYSIGTTYFEAEISYGVDKAGIKSAYTEGKVLYGQWTYAFEDNYLVITYPTGEQFKYEPVLFEPINVTAEEHFLQDSDLVGVWKSTDTEETYEFTKDGYFTYTCDYEDELYKFTIVSEGRYKTDFTDVTITTYTNATETNSQSFDYLATGDTLTMDDYTYTRVTE